MENEWKNLNMKTRKTMSNRETYILLITAIFLLFLTACGSGNQQSTPTPTYNVTFVTNGGTAVADRNNVTSIATEPVTTRSGYDFAGWYTSSTFSGSRVAFPYTVTANITLYANWTPENAQTYNVTFVTNGGTAVVARNNVASIATEPVTTRSGYDFAGWYTSSTFSGSRVTFPYTVTANTTLYANWTLPVAPADAIHIKTAVELANIGGASSAGKYYVLDNDIDLTAEWAPIMGFLGTFDGRDYSINNLYVRSSSEKIYAGLFYFIPTTDEEVNIMNVTINIGEEGVNANSSFANIATYAGGIVGDFVNKGSISNCFVNGSVHASGLFSGTAGGIAGIYGSPKISENLATTGSVFANAPRINYAGGLFGRFLIFANPVRGGVRSSYSTALVNAVTIGTSNSSFKSVASAGGLIGYISSNDSIDSPDFIISDSYATGEITASLNRNDSGSSTAEVVAGGLIGDIENSISIVNSYALGDVSGSVRLLINNIRYSQYEYGYVGGIYGVRYSSDTVDVINCYRVSTQNLTNTDRSPNTEGALLTPEEMQHESSFNGWDFTNIWVLDGYEYPQLRAFSY